MFKSMIMTGALAALALGSSLMFVQPASAAAGDAARVRGEDRGAIVAIHPTMDDCLTGSGSFGKPITVALPDIGAAPGATAVTRRITAACPVADGNEN